MTSRKFTCVRPVSTVISRVYSLKKPRSCCLSFSSCWGLILLWWPIPSSLYKAKHMSGNLSLILASSIKPTKSVIWAPS